MLKNEGSSGCSVELYEKGTLLDETTIVPKHCGHVNSYHYYPSSENFVSQAPLSTTTVFSFKLRSHINPTSLRVNSKYAKKAILKLNKETIVEVDSTSIKSFEDLIKVQDDFTVPHIKKIAETLFPKELLILLLKE